MLPLLFLPVLSACMAAAGAFSVARVLGLLVREHRHDVEIA